MRDEVKLQARKPIYGRYRTYMFNACSSFISQLTKASVIRCLDISGTIDAM